MACLPIAQCSHAKPKKAAAYTNGATNSAERLHPRGELGSLKTPPPVWPGWSPHANNSCVPQLPTWPPNLGLSPPTALILEECSTTVPTLSSTHPCATSVTLRAGTSAPAQLKKPRRARPQPPSGLPAYVANFCPNNRDPLASRAGHAAAHGWPRTKGTGLRRRGPSEHRRLLDDSHAPSLPSPPH